MTEKLWQANRPQDFWMCQPDFPDDIWEQAITNALPVLGIPALAAFKGMDSFLETVLGEGQFGKDRYRLSFAKRVYYQIKPFFPQPVAWLLRRWYSNPDRQQFPLQWPIEPRYAGFQWEVIRQVMALSAKNQIRFVNFWPEGELFGLVLTHDIETSIGQNHVRAVADLEESLGFRSSFNFIPERYPLDENLISELIQRGFEVGIHGLKHDGKLYRSRQTFMERCARINEYLEKYKAVGFRSPLTHREPEWMQSLKIEYDLSFFDTDPYEPMPGGTMSIYPYFIGHFVELPYTLMQDYTLTSFLHETTPRIWLEKVSFIEKHFGMALVNSHPDYLLKEQCWNVYRQFLIEMKRKEHCFKALPRDAARWWRYRSSIKPDSDPKTYSTGNISLDKANLRFS
jgi:hypothetical protein